MTRARSSSVLVLIAGFGAGCGPPPAADDGSVRTRTAIRFEERIGGSGIDFEDRHGRVGTDKRHLVETLGGGVALTDFDGDGDLDVFLVGGDPTTGEPPQRSRLYRNDGGLAFTDVTESAGIDLRVDGTGVAAGDVDDDGDDDLFVATLGRNVLLLNRGDGTFEERGSEAGFVADLWSSSAAFADLDGDADLDLFVCGYCVWGEETVALSNQGGTFRDHRVIAGPRGFEGAPDLLYKNVFAETGRVAFEDVTVAAGLGDSRSYALGVVIYDADDDGDLDLYVANDSEPNALFLNDGGLSFTDHGMDAGVALDPMGNAQAGMGVDAGDVDGDGTTDLFVTNFSHDCNTLYLSSGTGLFRDGTRRSGLFQPTYIPLGFGCVMFDPDQDGDLDLAVANGHVFPEMDHHPLITRYAQPNQVFENDGGGRMTEVAGPFGDVVPAVSRGLARGDLDGDGRVDLFFTNINGRPSLMRNVSEAGGVVVLRLEATGGNRNAIGARVVAELDDGRRLRRLLVGGASYLSASSRAIHLGLGDASVRRIEVRWPSGAVQTVRGDWRDRLLRIEEGNDAVEASDLPAS